MTRGLEAASGAPPGAPERRFESIPAAARLAAVLIAAAILMSFARGPIAVGQTTLNGLVSAGYLALGAVGLTLVFGTLRIINFAHGDLLTLGAYLTFGISALGLPFWPAAAVAVALTALIAYALDFTENLEMGLAAAPNRPLNRRFDAMYALFPRLAERRRQKVDTMSGGERQMVAMARALMPEPSVLLLDEPSAGLAPLLVDAMFEQIRAINREGITILMVEQNARAALALSDRGYVLDLGRNAHEGRGREMIDDPRIAELYFGAAVPADNKGHPK